MVYETNWYYLPNKDMLNLILIISRSNSVIKITAGKMTHMSISTFGDVSHIYEVCKYVSHIYEKYTYILAYILEYATFT